MSAEADDALAQQLRALRREYLTDSTQRVAELRALYARLAQGDRGALADLRQAFHRLAGSGGSYGFPEVSARSREGEQLANRLAAEAIAPADLRATELCVEAVARAFADAVATLSGEPPA